MSSSLHKRTALVLGATGLVGSHLTRQLLRHDMYSKVRVFVRRDLTDTSLTSNNKLEQVRINFDEMHTIDSTMFTGDDAFCCLGTTIKKAGSKEAFYKVDYTYVNTFAQLCHANGVKQFVLVTSAGSSEDSLFFYPQVKGKIEKAVKEIGFDHVRIIRPSVLTGEREEYRCMEEIAKSTMSALSFMIPNKYAPIHGEQVAKAMIQIATSDFFISQPFSVHENAELLKY